MVIGLYLSATCCRVDSVVCATCQFTLHIIKPIVFFVSFWTDYGTKVIGKAWVKLTGLTSHAVIHPVGDSIGGIGLLRDVIQPIIDITGDGSSGTSGECSTGGVDAALRYRLHRFCHDTIEFIKCQHSSTIIHRVTDHIHSIAASRCCSDDARDACIECGGADGLRFIGVTRFLRDVAIDVTCPNREIASCIQLGYALPSVVGPVACDIAVGIYLFGDIA